MKKRIFGKIYEFSFDPEYEELLDSTLRFYDNAHDELSEILVSISKKNRPTELVSVNPKIHRKTTEGMSTNFGLLDVHWGWNENEQLVVDAVLKARSKGLVGFVKKLYSMEYSTDLEVFEQVLHELILVPSCYFFSDVALVHAACVRENGKAVLFAGTGGVGKSSALLTFREMRSCEFVSDDISIVDKGGFVYGNMAWPKVYGYNCEGNSIRDVLLKGRGQLDRLHFNVRYRMNPSRVRRKISPNRLFCDYRSGKTPIGALFYLVRENVDEMLVTNLDMQVAVNMSISVMSAEYQVFHKFIDWEYYNALACQKEPTLKMQIVMRNWRDALTHAFAAVKVAKVSVPITIDHNEYQKAINEIVRAELG